jgi:hypothetical protein
MTLAQFKLVGGVVKTLCAMLPIRAVTNTGKALIARVSGFACSKSAWSRLLPFPYRRDPNPFRTKASKEVPHAGHDER